MRTQKELYDFLQSKEGIALLEKHNLRRSYDPAQGLAEIVFRMPISLHERGKKGLIRSLGCLDIERRALGVIHEFPKGSKQREKLTEFAETIAARFNLNLHHYNEPYISD